MRSTSPLAHFKQHRLPSFSQRLPVPNSIYSVCGWGELKSDLTAVTPSSITF